MHMILFVGGEYVCVLRWSGPTETADREQQTAERGQGDESCC